MQRLFSTAKVLVFLDTYGPGVEKRRGEEVSILTLKLRVEPFDSKLALSIDSGVGGGNIRSTVFSLNNAEPKRNFTGHDFKFELARQDLVIYASTDTEVSRLSIQQVKIGELGVRTTKDNTLALVFKASFGPVSRDELEYIHAWVRGQRAVTFEESEPSMEFNQNPGDDGPQPEPTLPEVRH